MKLRKILFSYLCIGLSLLPSDAEADNLAMKDLRSIPDEPEISKQITDREEIERKMFQPARIPTSGTNTKVSLDATCTDARRVIRTSDDPLYKDCLEERPRVANPPLDTLSPGATTFGFRIAR